MWNYLDRFDQNRPVYVALESYADETNAAIQECIHLCFDSAFGSSWSCNASLATSLGVAFQRTLSRVITSDTIGIPLSRGVLGGGTWEFSIRDITGAIIPDAELVNGYSFTLILYQKSEV
jgi:hypothetical protein